MPRYLLLLPLLLCSCSSMAFEPPIGTPKAYPVPGATVTVNLRFVATETMAAAQTASEAGRQADVIISGNIAEQKRADADRAQAEETLSAAEMEFSDRTATAYAPAATGTKAFQETQIAQFLGKSTLDAAQLTATAQAPQFAAAAERAKVAGIWDVLVGTGAAGLGIFLATIGATVLYRERAAWKYWNRHTVAEEAPHVRLGAKPGELVPVSPNTLTLCPLAGAELRMYCEYALTGAPLGVQNASEALKGIVDRDGCWRMVSWLDEREYTAFDRRQTEAGQNYTVKSLSQKGRDWCNERLGAPSPTPQEDMSPISPPVE